MKIVRQADQFPDMSKWSYSDVWFHTGDPNQWSGNKYYHLGTMNSVLDRHDLYPTRAIWKITISPQRPLNTINNPLEDSEANILCEWMEKSHGSGEQPGYDAEALAYRGDIAEIIFRTNWTPQNDAIYYTNFMEGKGDISVAILPSCVVSKVEMVGTQEPLFGVNDQFGNWVASVR
jgi:hypothetical protein